MASPPLFNSGHDSACCNGLPCGMVNLSKVQFQAFTFFFIFFGSDRKFFDSQLFNSIELTKEIALQGEGTGTASQLSADFRSFWEGNVRAE